MDFIFEFCLDCLLVEIDLVELVILWLFIYELCNCIDVFYKVVINEGIELVKIFGVIDGYKFVNGVFDKLVLCLCVVELCGGKC